jgi:hypothetical protein
MKRQTKVGLIPTLSVSFGALLIAAISTTVYLEGTHHFKYSCGNFLEPLYKGF